MPVLMSFMEPRHLSSRTGWLEEYFDINIIRFLHWLTAVLQIIIKLLGCLEKYYFFFIIAVTSHTLMQLTLFYNCIYNIVWQLTFEISISKKLVQICLIIIPLIMDNHEWTFRHVFFFIIVKVKMQYKQEKMYVMCIRGCVDVRKARISFQNFPFHPCTIHYILLLWCLLTTTRSDLFWMVKVSIKWRYQKPLI